MRVLIILKMNNQGTVFEDDEIVDLVNTIKAQNKSEATLKAWSFC